MKSRKLQKSFESVQNYRGAEKPTGENVELYLGIVYSRIVQHRAYGKFGKLLAA